MRSNAAMRRLWVAGLISEAGDWLLAVALPVHVFRTTGSALATSVVFLLGLVPAAVLGPVAGALVDRWEHRRTLVVVALLQAAFLVPLAVPAASRHLGVLYAVMLAQTVLAQFSEPARSAIVPELVPAEELTAANGLLATATNVARLAGAGAGGLVLEVAHLTGVALGDIATFLGAAALLAALPRRSPAAAVDRPRVTRELREGAALIGRDRRLRAAMVVFGLAGLAQGMFVVLHVVFILDRLGQAPSAAGFLRGIQAVGGLTAGLVLARWGRAWRDDRLLAIGLVAMGAVSLTIWSLPPLTTALPAYVVLFAVVGAPGVVFGSALATVVQRTAPPEALGRVFAAGWSLNSLLQAAGTLAAGALATAGVGLYALLLVQASTYLAAGALSAVAARRPHLAEQTREAAGLDGGEPERGEDPLVEAAGRLGRDLAAGVGDAGEDPAPVGRVR
jgi:MFS family permease